MENTEKPLKSVPFLTDPSEDFLLTKEETKQAVDELDSVYKLRISVGLYQKLLGSLQYVSP